MKEAKEFAHKLSENELTLFILNKTMKMQLHWEKMQILLSRN